MYRRVFAPYGQCGNCELLSYCGSDLFLSDCQFYKEVKNENVPSPVHQAKSEFPNRRERELFYLHNGQEQ
jgi:hypothetical protein